jgi:hypothetical protein
LGLPKWQSSPSVPTKKHFQSEGRTMEVKIGFYLDVILYWTEVNDRDYHKTMNGELFEKWVVENLIAALRLLNSKCVAIMDNAPHHSIRLESPRTSASRKEEIKQ